MKPVIFFLYLCFLLLKGNDPVYKSTLHNGIGYPQAQQIEKNRRVVYTDPARDYAVLKNADTGKERQCLLCEDVEEEDTNDFSPRKYRIQAGYNITGFYYFNAWHLTNRVKASQAFCRLPSDIYSIQRVLRI